MQHKIYYICEFIKTESATAVQRVFHLRFNIQPPTRKSICRWNHQFEQIDCLRKGKSSGRPGVSEENLRRIQESFECSPCNSTRRASRELQIPQPTAWRVSRRRLLFNCVRLFESPCISWRITKLVIRYRQFVLENYPPTLQITMGCPVFFFFFLLIYLIMVLELILHKGRFF